MNKKIYWLALSALLFALSFSAEAQQPKKVPRIGYLFVGLQPPKEFLQAMAKLGYIEGKNFAFEYRAAEGREERLPALAAELVKLNVDVIIAPGVLPALAAKEATKSIPVIYTGGGDPIAAGLVASVARPGGNVTAIAELSSELTGKRLELIKETAPKISAVTVLVRGDAPLTTDRIMEIETAAKAFGLRLHILHVRATADFDKVFSGVTKERNGALIEVPNSLFHASRKRIVEFANQKRLPTIFHSMDFVEAGGLMCYGESDAETLRRLTVYVDKILKGTKPADLPVEYPMRFEFVVNLKTAKQIGVTIPPNLLVRANRVIR
ncbi:MAG: ABC transporter substrate-binding protein [Deltaproteobacteria bacterium]|nr:ABC transporter substrate-binding protein [Deltaproteobacteria bacterium]